MAFAMLVGCGSGSQADDLVGRWGDGEDCKYLLMEFFADGRAKIAPSTKQRYEMLTWRVPAPGRLQLTRDGRDYTGSFEVRDGGRTLRTAFSNSPATDLTRC